MAKYTTPAWANNAAPAINAANLLAMGQGIELAQHPYGVCSTAAATEAKTVTVDVPGTLTLFAGLVIRVKFENTNKTSSPTLNVNSSGAKAITRNGTDASTTWAAGETLELIYDGTSWVTMASSNTSSIVFTSGTYTGAGEYGSLLEANFIRFPFKPLLVVVGKYIDDNPSNLMYGLGLTPGMNQPGWDSSFIWFSGQRYSAMVSEDHQSVTNLVHTLAALSAGEYAFTFSWYSTLDAYTQCNVLGKEYPYFALGVRTL